MVESYLVSIVKGSKSPVHLYKNFGWGVSLILVQLVLRASQASQAPLLLIAAPALFLLLPQYITDDGNNRLADDLSAYFLLGRIQNEWNALRRAIEMWKEGQHASPRT